ncbi:MAG TPA: DUF423 domain-containing protein [Bacteriovoracaceae bacterium]|nr:DUF423 domain-containing protein [Bacteriovoracaceae bacterium]
MNISQMAKRGILTGTVMLALAVLIGAFGAHGLKAIVTPEKLVTFETGVRYHFYHGFGLILLGLFAQLFQSLRLSVSLYSFLVGIVLFSFNCYLYVLTDMKIFAMIVPVGGLLFVVGWVNFAWKVLKLNYK